MIGPRGQPGIETATDGSPVAVSLRKPGQAAASDLR